MMIFVRKESWNPRGSTKGRDKEKSCAKEKNCNTITDVRKISVPRGDYSHYH